MNDERDLDTPPDDDDIIQAPVDESDVSHERQEIETEEDEVSNVNDDATNDLVYGEGSVISLKERNLSGDELDLKAKSSTELIDYINDSGERRLLEESHRYSAALDIMSQRDTQRDTQRDSVSPAPSLQPSPPPPRPPPPPQQTEHEEQPDWTNMIDPPDWEETDHHSFNSNSLIDLLLEDIPDLPKPTEVESFAQSSSSKFSARVGDSSSESDSGSEDSASDSDSSSGSSDDSSSESSSSGESDSFGSESDEGPINKGTNRTTGTTDTVR